MQEFAWFSATLTGATLWTLSICSSCCVLKSKHWMLNAHCQDFLKRRLEQNLLISFFEIHFFLLLFATRWKKQVNKMIFLVLQSTLPRNNQKIVFKTRVLSEIFYLFFIAVLFFIWILDLRTTFSEVCFLLWVLRIINFSSKKKQLLAGRHIKSYLKC